jgi:hypothetical protein
MEINFLALLTAAFSTLVVGFVWYNQKFWHHLDERIWHDQ